MYDSSYMSYVSFLQIEVQQRHPVVHVFLEFIQCRCLISEDRRRRRRRFRWALFYTLIRNEQLKYLRKHHLILV